MFQNSEKEQDQRDVLTKHLESLRKNIFSNQNKINPYQF